MTLGVSAGSNPNAFVTVQAGSQVSGQRPAPAAVVPGGAVGEQQQPDSVAPTSIVELQPFRQSTSLRLVLPSGREGVATLVDLNPALHSWYLLGVTWKDGTAEPVAHLENAKPRSARLLLDEKFPSGIVVREGGESHPCELFGPEGGAEAPLALARRSKLAYAPLCEGRVSLRNPTKGRSTVLESAVALLRDRVWQGEQLINVFHHLLADRYRETGVPGVRLPATPQPKAGRRPAAQPLPAAIDSRFADRPVIARDMGIALQREGTVKEGMIPGTWYAGAVSGTWVSIIEPTFIAPSILQSHRTIVNSLDNVEASSLCYLVAFDLERFEIGFELGTDHPRVNWSDRVPEPMRNSGAPGPDGIGTISPLVTLGMVRPDVVPKTVAAFVGGFKRTHGAFKSGELALRNRGSHYGFLEHGVVFSTLQPGLATVVVFEDGSLDMKTWTEADTVLLPRLRHARQNGVPIIVASNAQPKGTGADGAPQLPTPGSLVGRWGSGNWSGSADEKLRTMRAGLALQESHGKRFLIYAVFSAATPSAMARVFQSYQVSYAMLLDMNALEHTYLAVYRRSGGELTVDHLITGMRELDKVPSGEPVPRFLGYADNRDFFYVVRRDEREAAP